MNADDLGMSDSVNEAIFEGMRSRVITSATILANGPALESAARALHKFPHCSFGVHLNLTEFEPVRRESRKQLASIIDGHGCFNGNSIREVNIDTRLLRAIFWEWCGQIEKLMQLGVELSHLDAHHHVHTIPRLLPVLIALRRRFKINKIRISRNMYDDIEHPGRMLLEKKRLFNAALRAIGFRTTRIFTDLGTFIKLCADDPPRARSAELMTHPDMSVRSAEASLLAVVWPEKLSYKSSLISYKSL